MPRPARRSAAKARALISTLAKSGALGRRGRYGKKKALTKPQKAQVKKIVKGSQETKYVAQQILQNFSIDAPIHTPTILGTTSGDMFPLVPQIFEGPAENQRIGRKVMPTRCYVDVQLTFPQAPLGSPQAPNLPLSNELYVKMFILRSKEIHNWNLFATNTSAPWLSLLDNGDATAVPFGNPITYSSGAAGFITQPYHLGMPVEKSHFTLIKEKIVKLVRNVGLMYGDGTPGNAPNLPQSCWKGRFYYKLPKLIYDDTKGNVQALDNYPTNCNVFMAVGYVYANNQPSWAIAPDGTTTPLPNDVSITARVNTWYKDA